MRRGILFFVLIAAGSSGTAAVAWASPSTTPTSQPSASETLQRQARAVADQLPWMSLDFVDDQVPSWGSNAEKVEQLWGSLLHPPSLADRTVAGDMQVELAIRPTPWTAEEIRPLLHDPDPKVRTLGITLMYELNRVDVLPELAPLAFDEAPTFVSPGKIPPDYSSGIDYSSHPQSVSMFAKAVIATYARYSLELDALQLGMYWAGPPRGTPAELQHTLAAFAAQRDPLLCTASLRVALARAIGGVSPVAEDRRGRIRAVVGLLQMVPMPRRFFVALTLSHQDGAEGAYSPDSLNDLARQVPRDLRLKAMRGECPIDDPDLADFGTLYFSNHVVEFFRASDADFFLRLAADEKPQVGQPNLDQIAAARDEILAAKLRPGDADAILGKAMDMLTGSGSMSDDARGEVALAMAQVGGAASLERAVNWIYTVQPQPGAYGAGREGLLTRLAMADPARARILNEKLIRDPRLDVLGPYSTRLLVQAVQGYLGRSVATEEEIRRSYGIDEAQRDEHFAPLAAWHQALRATVDEWSR